MKIRSDQISSGLRSDCVELFCVLRPISPTAADASCHCCNEGHAKGREPPQLDCLGIERICGENDSSQEVMPIHL